MENITKILYLQRKMEQNIFQMGRDIYYYSFCAYSSKTVLVESRRQNITNIICTVL